MGYSVINIYETFGASSAPERAEQFGFLYAKSSYQKKWKLFLEKYL